MHVKRVLWIVLLAALGISNLGWSAQRFIMSRKIFQRTPATRSYYPLVLQAQRLLLLSSQQRNQKQHTRSHILSITPRNRIFQPHGHGSLSGILFLLGMGTLDDIGEFVDENESITLTFTKSNETSDIVEFALNAKKTSISDPKDFQFTKIVKIENLPTLSQVLYELVRYYNGTKTSQFNLPISKLSKAELDKLDLLAKDADWIFEVKKTQSGIEVTLQGKDTVSAIGENFTEAIRNLTS